MTSRGTRRWIIPKGWPKRGKSPYDTAAKEAFEEAGVVGKVSRRPIGSYPYDKILETGDKASCRVDVFALRVTRQRKRWPEKLERQVRWYPPAEAARFCSGPAFASDHSEIHEKHKIKISQWTGIAVISDSSPNLPWQSEGGTRMRSVSAA